MRVVKQSQGHLGQVDIAKIQFDTRSRDDIPAVLKGLQYIYVNEPVRAKVFALLENSLTTKTSRKMGQSFLKGNGLARQLYCAGT